MRNMIKAICRIHEKNYAFFLPSIHHYIEQQTQIPTHKQQKLAEKLWQIHYDYISTFDLTRPHFKRAIEKELQKWIH